MTVQAGAAAVVKSASGIGMSLPAGALTSVETLEVKVYDVQVTISDEQAGDPISPAGPLGVFLPHGLQFAAPVSLVMSYDASKVPSGHTIYVFYYNEDVIPPQWEKMEGNVVGPGLVETKTTHFSTFGAMSTPSGGGGGGGGGGKVVNTTSNMSTPLPASTTSWGAMSTPLPGGGGGGGGIVVPVVPPIVPPPATGTSNPLSPAKVKSPTVEAEIVLNIALTDFNLNTQNKFLGALAAAASVTAGDVSLLEVPLLIVQNIRRDDMPNSTKIVSGIKADDPQRVVTSLTLDSLNAALRNSGLPNASSLTTRILPSAGMGAHVIIAIVVGVVGGCASLAAAYLFWKRTTSQNVPKQAAFIPDRTAWPAASNSLQLENISIETSAGFRASTISLANMGSDDLIQGSDDLIEGSNDLCTDPDDLEEGSNDLIDWLDDLCTASDDLMEGSDDLLQGSDDADWIKCSNCNRPCRSTWPRCPNGACLKPLPPSKTTTNVGPSRLSSNLLQSGSVGQTQSSFVFGCVD